MSDAPDTTELKRITARPSSFRRPTFHESRPPQKEPVIAARWKDEDLYGQFRKARAGARSSSSTTAPYANGDIHIGHRSTRPEGHGRPHPDFAGQGRAIRSRLGTATAFRSNGRSRSSTARRSSTRTRVPPKEFRAECRAYAQHWVDVQREQFQRLGITGDWDNPYLTMDFEAEATIVSELYKFAGERPALSRRQAGHVVAGREDRARRGRDRI
jgi:isoleucyl-tRNA synthetase